MSTQKGFTFLASKRMSNGLWSFELLPKQFYRIICTKKFYTHLSSIYLGFYEPIWYKRSRRMIMYWLIELVGIIWAFTFATYYPKNFYNRAVPYSREKMQTTLHEKFKKTRWWMWTVPLYEVWTMSYSRHKNWREMAKYKNSPSFE